MSDLRISELPDGQFIDCAIRQRAWSMRGNGRNVTEEQIIDSIRLANEEFGRSPAWAIARGVARLEHLVARAEFSAP